METPIIQTRNTTIVSCTLNKEQLDEVLLEWLATKNIDVRQRSSATVVFNMNDDDVTGVMIDVVI